jgi:hypothetical protein
MKGGRGTGDSIAAVEGGPGPSNFTRFAPLAMSQCPADVATLSRCTGDGPDAATAGAQGHPMKPHRMRMTHNLLLHYDLYKQMEVRPAGPTPCPPSHADTRLAVYGQRSQPMPYRRRSMHRRRYASPGSDGATPAPSSSRRRAVGDTAGWITQSQYLTGRMRVCPLWLPHHRRGCRSLEPASTVRPVARAGPHAWTCAPHHSLLYAFLHPPVSRSPPCHPPVVVGFSAARRHARRSLGVTRP